MSDRYSQGSFTKPTPQSDGVSIILPNYNGAPLLRLYLPTVWAAAERSVHDVEIIIADDASDDDSIQWVTDTFPVVKIVSSELNSGFGENCNRGALAASFSRILFLNTDIRVEVDFIDPLVDALDSAPDVFAVSGRMVEHHPDQCPTHVGYTYGCYRRGSIEPRILHLHLDNEADTKTREILWACGGMMMCDKKRFLEIGGFDPIYSPFYWEDTDLCYNAWKRGWRVLYEPKSTVHHMRDGTIARLYSREHVVEIMNRNEILFAIKNITDAAKAMQFAYHYLVGVVLRYGRKQLGLAARGPKCRPLPFSLLSVALGRRRRSKSTFTVRDADILPRFEAGAAELQRAEPISLKAPSDVQPAASVTRSSVATGFADFKESA